MPSEREGLGGDPEVGGRSLEKEGRWEKETSRSVGHREHVIVNWRSVRSAGAVLYIVSSISVTVMSFRCQLTDDTRGASSEC